MKLVNWVRTLRADVIDIRGILDEVLDGARGWFGRALDRENNSFVGETAMGGHVLSGFALDLTTGLATAALGAGVYFDADGLPIIVPASVLDLSAYAGAVRVAIWARWEHVDSDTANRKRWLAGAEAVFAHPTRQTPTVYFALTANKAVVPPGAYSWTLIGELEATAGVLPANPQFVPNALWDLTQNATRPVTPVGGGPPVAVPVVGGPLYGALEYLRGVFEAVRGTGGGVAAWDDPVVAPDRTVQAMNAALISAEANIVTLFANDALTALALDKLPLAGARWDAGAAAMAEGWRVAGAVVMGVGDVQFTLSAPLPAGTFLGPVHVNITTLEPYTAVHSVVYMDPTLPVATVRIRSYAIDLAAGLVVPQDTSYTWQMSR